MAMETRDVTRRMLIRNYGYGPTVGHLDESLDHVRREHEARAAYEAGKRYGNYGGRITAVGGSPLPDPRPVREALARDQRPRTPIRDALRSELPLPLSVARLAGRLPQPRWKD